MKIKCPQCDFENEEGSKFCNKCNIPLIKSEAFNIKENPYIKKENTKLCENCGKKLPFITSETLCIECKIAYESELSKIEKEILEIKKVTEQQLEFLKKQDKRSLLKLYFRLYDQFEADKELEVQEIETLQKIQKAFSLTNEDIKFDERIRPYIYVNTIKKEGKSPSIDLHIEDGGQVILKKEEIVQFTPDTPVLKMKKSIIILCVFIIVSTIGIYGINYFRLQSQMNDVLKDDPRNNGIEVSVHYGNYVNPSVLVYDLKSISNTNSMADVFRVFLQLSEKVQSKKFDVVELSFMGKTKFKIKGEYFQTLGKEYTWQNPVYTIRTFPENLVNLNDSMAYPKWTGGWLGVTGKQMEDFNDFHKKWYLEDIVKE